MKFRITNASIFMIIIMHNNRSYKGLEKFSPFFCVIYIFIGQVKYYHKIQSLYYIRDLYINTSSEMKK